MRIYDHISTILFWTTIAARLSTLTSLKRCNLVGSPWKEIMLMCVKFEVFEVFSNFVSDYSRSWNSVTLRSCSPITRLFLIRSDLWNTARGFLLYQPMDVWVSTEGLVIIENCKNLKALHCLLGGRMTKFCLQQLSEFARLNISFCSVVTATMFREFVSNKKTQPPFCAFQRHTNQKVVS